MSTPSRHVPFTTELQSPLSRICRALAGGHLDTKVRTVFAHDGLRDLILHKVLTQIDDECSVLCRRAEPSRTAPEKLSQFKWKSYVDEMESKAPTLLQLLMHLVSHWYHTVTAEMIPKKVIITIQQFVCQQLSY